MEPSHQLYRQQVEFSPDRKPPKGAPPMKKFRFEAAGIVSVLKQVQGGRHVRDVCREHGISEATYYNWKSKYGGMESSYIKRLKELERENQRLNDQAVTLVDQTLGQSTQGMGDAVDLRGIGLGDDRYTHGRRG